jgi:hypothetical protein
MQTLFTVIGILGLVFVVFAAIFVVSLLVQLALAPFTPRIAKRYDDLKAKLPAGPPRSGHASVIHLQRDPNN